MLEGGEFGGGWFVPDEEQVGDFFEGCVVGEVLDVVAAVDEVVLLDGADGAVAGDHAFEACFGLSSGGGAFREASSVGQWRRSRRWWRFWGVQCGLG